MQMRGSCDPGGASDGSRLAIYQALCSECPTLCSARACVRHVSVSLNNYGIPFAARLGVASVPPTPILSGTL